MIKLYEHQLDAVNRIQNGSILCGDVGSGKSMTALAYYYVQNGGDLSMEIEEYIPMNDPPQDLYIITTARKRDTLEWEKELSNWLLTSLSGPSTYSNIVVIDSWNNISKYEKVKKAFFIFDEQRLVGNGVWVKTFLKIAKENNWILLSATPGDTWSDYIPVFIANGFYKNRTQFNDEHVIYCRSFKFPKIDRYVNTNRLVRLRDKILIDMDFERHTTSCHETITVSYDKELYKELFVNRWNIFKNEPIINASELCYNLRKLVNSDESRQVALLELCEKHPRIIVFYNHDYERDILLNMYFGDDITVAEWTGHKHQEVPDTEKWVYLVQYTAGCEGWNCIKTDTIVFYSQNYSYKVLKQAEGRINRLNTPFLKLYYYHFKSRAGIDNAIALALRHKKNFNEMRFSNR